MIKFGYIYEGVEYSVDLIRSGNGKEVIEKLRSICGENISIKRYPGNTLTLYINKHIQMAYETSDDRWDNIVFMRGPDTILYKLDKNTRNILSFCYTDESEKGNPIISSCDNEYDEFNRPIHYVVIDNNKKSDVTISYNGNLKEVLQNINDGERINKSIVKKVNDGIFDIIIDSGTETHIIIDFNNNTTDIDGTIIKGIDETISVLCDHMDLYLN